METQDAIPSCKKRAFVHCGPCYYAHGYGERRLGEVGYEGKYYYPNVSFIFNIT